MDPDFDARMRRQKLLLRFGILLLIVAAGILPIGAVIGVNSAFQKVERMKSPTPDDLARGTQFAIVRSVTASTCVAIFGIAFIAIALINRSRLKSRIPAPPVVPLPPSLR